MDENEYLKVVVPEFEIFVEVAEKQFVKYDKGKKLNFKKGAE